MAEIHQLHQKSDFDRWYAVYPRRQAKKQAMRAFEKAQREEDWPGTDGAIEAVKLYIRCKPEYQDYKMPATWLNQGCWSDEWIVPKSEWEKIR